MAVVVGREKGEGFYCYFTGSSTLSRPFMDVEDAKGK